MVWVWLLLGYIVFINLTLIGAILNGTVEIAKRREHKKYKYLYYWFITLFFLVLIPIASLYFVPKHIYKTIIK